MSYIINEATGKKIKVGGPTWLKIQAGTYVAPTAAPKKRAYAKGGNLPAGYEWSPESGKAIKTGGATHKAILSGTYTLHHKRKACPPGSVRSCNPGGRCITTTGKVYRDCFGGNRSPKHFEGGQFYSALTSLAANEPSMRGHRRRHYY